MNHAQTWLPGMAGDQSRHADRLIKAIRPIQHGHHPFQVFDDFLSLTLASLEALPSHAISAIEHGRLAGDTASTRQLFERMRARYRREDFSHFARGLAVLLESTEYGMMDVLGQAYMVMEIGNALAGQYFTPMPVARMMAQVIIGDGEAAVYARLLAALDHCPEVQRLWQMRCLLIDSAGGTLTAAPDDHESPSLTEAGGFFRAVLPALLPHAEPITILDPCVGSGVMLLAAAAQFPAWAVHSGLVQFYGQDIDWTCVQMCKINALLYGLRGSKVQTWQEMSLPERTALPAPVANAYEAAEASLASGTPLPAARATLNEQLNLFG